MKFKGVRSLKHKHDRMYQENLRKANSLADLSSSPQGNQEGAPSGQHRNGSQRRERSVSPVTYRRSPSCPPSGSNLNQPQFDKAIFSHDSESKKPVTFFESLINPDPPKPHTKATRYARLAGLPINRSIDDYVGQGVQEQPRWKSLSSGLGINVKVSDLSARFESGTANKRNLHGHSDSRSMPSSSRTHVTSLVHSTPSSGKKSSGTDSGSPFPESLISKPSHTSSNVHHSTWQDASSDQQEAPTGRSSYTRPRPGDVRSRSRSPAGTRSPRSDAPPPVPDVVPPSHLSSASQPPTNAPAAYHNSMVSSA